MLPYPEMQSLKNLVNNIEEFAKLKTEYGSKGVGELIGEIRTYLKSALEKVKCLPTDRYLADKEPNEYYKIMMLRPDGPRKMWEGFDEKLYREKLEGALLARLAGCTLGAPVEGWSIEQMQRWAEYSGDSFPPVDYWSYTKNPGEERYRVNKWEDFTKSRLDKVPTDDDIAYTLLGLLIAEEYGTEFTTDNVAEAWLKYLPMACTAEAIALSNLKAGMPSFAAAEKNNPYCQWIGAAIRSDPWAYIAPGYPEKAARMAYRDAFLSHRRNGIYGEMFFSAAQSAAFAVDNAVDAIKIGLTEIPSECALAKDIRWALEVSENIRDYRDARKAVDERFKDMSPVHTNNNACLTVFGLIIGGNDVTKVLSQTVAMGLDNDCTAATAGSIVGAIVGKEGIPTHWYERFNNKIYSYLNGIEVFRIDDVVERFTKLAESIYC